MCGRCGVRSLALLLQALLAVGVTEVSGVTPSVITPVVTPSVITLGVTPGVTLGVTLRALAPHSDRSHGGLTVERCQSLDLETFTCWWSPRPEDAAANYSLLYYTPNHLLTDSCGNEKTQHRMFATNDSVMCECPDYETGGLNSCYFNTTFTFLFRMYCFLIWDRSRPDIDGQQQFCTTVADITQTNPPWNLTWELVGDEAGEGATEHELGEVRLRWQPPLEPDIRSGWITLEYQIRVRDNSTLNWTLREEHVSVMHHVLLGPRPGRPLEVQVRCKPRTLGIWSEWSESLLVITEGWDLLQVLLVLGVLVSCCLLATLLLLLRCHTRMAKWLFPPVPSPRIRGIDPDMLKKGPVEEFNRMISSFHGFVSPVMHDDPWLEVTEVTCERDTLLAKVKGGWRSTGPATPTHGRPVWPGEAAAAAATIEPDLLGYFHGDLPENSAKSTANADDGYDDRQKHGDGGGGGGSEAMRSATTLPGECYTQVWDVSPDGTVCLASPAAQALRPAAAVARPAAPAAHVGESAGSKEIAESSASRGRDVTVSPTGTGDSQPPPFVLEPPALAITTTPPARLGPMIASDTHVPPTSPPSPPPQSHQAEGSSRRSDPHDERDATAIAGASSSSPHNDDDDDWEDATPLPPPPPPHNSSDRAPLRSPDSPPPVPDYTAVHAVDAHQRLFLDVRKDVVKGNGDAHKGYLPPEQLRALLLASAGVGVGVGVRVGVGSTQGYVGEERARFIRS
ncbi:prolactin receptor isoform X2 [Petromyzon marinus]|uniref:prolactin receptor isoform X2 n=1 Tax=Petromyzon marinus TaxID=7757 RepID=UPI003F730DFD